MEKILYRPKGTCSKLIDIDVKGGVIQKVEFTGGCPGNLLAISELIKGMQASDAVEKLEGIKCGDKKTSCADQLAQALRTSKH